MSFDYRVDAESSAIAGLGDGLVFYVDGIPVLEQKSYQFNWARFEAHLEAGVHKLEWIYKKDSFGTVGMDRAYLRDLEVHGFEFFDSRCENCPPGTFSNEGASVRDHIFSLCLSLFPVPPNSVMCSRYCMFLSRFRNFLRSIL